MPKGMGMGSGEGPRTLTFVRKWHSSLFKIKRSTFRKFYFLEKRVFVPKGMGMGSGEGPGTLTFASKWHSSLLKLFFPYSEKLYFLEKRLFVPKGMGMGSGVEMVLGHSLLQANGTALFLTSISPHSENSIV